MAQARWCDTTQKVTQTLATLGADEQTWGRLIPLAATRHKYQVIELNNSTYKIGRDVNNDVVLPEPQISSKHCILERNCDGNILVTDCSSNGTFINKHKIGKHQKHTLFDEDELILLKQSTKKNVSRISFVFCDTRRRRPNKSEGGLLDKYVIRQTLGSGSFATVKLGINRQTGQQAAVKEIDIQKYQIKCKNKKKDGVKNECDIMKQIDHNNVIKVYDMFETSAKLYIALEYAQGGDLHGRMKNPNKNNFCKIDEKHARIVMLQIVEALAHLHAKNIAHRDLKPENILMKDKNSWDIKITDFGLSRLLEVDDALFSTMCGTPMYLAPEVLTSRQRGGYGFEVDLWSVGVILYFMLVAHAPYSGGVRILELVRNGKFSFPHKSWQHVSPTALDLTRRLMCTDPKKRLSTHQMRVHPWLQGYDQFPQNYDHKSLLGWKEAPPTTLKGTEKYKNAVTGKNHSKQKPQQVRAMQKVHASDALDAVGGMRGMRGTGRVQAMETKEKCESKKRVSASPAMALFGVKGGGAEQTGHTGHTGDAGHAGHVQARAPQGRFGKKRLKTANGAKECKVTGRKRNLKESNIDNNVPRQATGFFMNEKMNFGMNGNGDGLLQQMQQIGQIGQIGQEPPHKRRRVEEAHRNANMCALSPGDESKQVLTPSDVVPALKNLSVVAKNCATSQDSKSTNSQDQDGDVDKNKNHDQKHSSRRPLRKSTDNKTPMVITSTRWLPSRR